MTRAPGHVALVGLPAAGKTTVGRLVAAALGRAFVDFDEELTRRAGVSVADQFATRGEAAFRAAEAALSREMADATDPAVLAPGGGWMINVAAYDALRPVARTVYLRIPPAVAARRLGADATVRPLLAVTTDPVAAVADLLARRGAVYEQADAVVAADGAPELVAAAVVALVRGWERTPGHSTGRPFAEVVR